MFLRRPVPVELFVRRYRRRLFRKIADRNTKRHTDLHNRIVSILRRSEVDWQFVLDEYIFREFRFWHRNWLFLKICIILGLNRFDFWQIALEISVSRKISFDREKMKPLN